MFQTVRFYLLLAGIVGVFLGVSEPILMSGMSRIVGEDEQGNLISFLKIQDTRGHAEPDCSYSRAR